MKIHLVCFILILFAPFWLMGQQSRPVINFVEKEFNFGTFRESEGIVNP